MNLSAIQKGVGSVAKKKGPKGGNLVEVTANTIELDFKSAFAEVLPEIGDLTAGQIQADAPKRQSKYARDWTFKMQGKDTVTVYNGGKRASLSHLLELGHRSRNGSWVAPQPHIRPAYNASKKIYLDLLKKAAISQINHKSGRKTSGK